MKYIIGIIIGLSWMTAVSAGGVRGLEANMTLPKRPSREAIMVAPLPNCVAPFAHFVQKTEATLHDIETIHHLAMKGNVLAQAALGDVYARGQGREQDWVLAKRWYYAAAEKNNTYAQYMLGIIYQYGLASPVNAVEASKWYARGDKNRDAACSRRVVADFFADYNNVAYNPQQAFRWYESSADAGDIDAQNDMGDILLQGRWTSRDVLGAVKWYGKAAEKFSPYAQYNLGLIYLNGDPSFPQDYNEAVEWFYLAAERGYAPAQFTLGDMFYMGEGVKQDSIEAYAWWKLAEQSAPNNVAITAVLNEVTRKMTDPELQLAVKLANTYQQKFGRPPVHAKANSSKKPHPKSVHHATALQAKDPAAPAQITVNEDEYRDNPFWQEYVARQQKYQ